jgi:Holliday junction resolvase
MRLKSHLQYERNFCNLSQSIGWHAERVAASGRRRGSVCDAVLFTQKASYLVEIKSTRANSFSLANGLHGLVEVADKLPVKALIAVYFKSSHSCKGKGVWVWKVITKDLGSVKRDDRPDEI